MCDWNGAYHTGDCCPPCWGVTDVSCVGQLPKFGGQRCERGSAATRDCSRVVEEVRSVFWDLCDMARKQHGPSAMRGSSGKQPTRTRKRLRIPTIATRSGTPGSRSCKFATSAHRPKCRVRKDPSHHSGRPHAACNTLDFTIPMLALS